MTYEVHIVNTHSDETGFMMTSDEVSNRYQDLVSRVYEEFYNEEQVFAQPAKIEFNTDSQLWEKIIKIQSFDSVSKAKLFAFRWAHRPQLSWRARRNAKNIAGCSLDILIVDKNNTVVEEISSKELYSREYANKGENKPTNG